MSASDDEIARLLANQDETLARWFHSFMSVEEPDLILAGGEAPPPSRVGEMFDRWFRRSRQPLQRLLCDKLRYGMLSDNQRTYGEVATVALVATALASSSLPQALDPVATAVLLVARRSLDGLCDGAVSTPSEPHRDQRSHP